MPVITGPEGTTIARLDDEGRPQVTRTPWPGPVVNRPTTYQVLCEAPTGEAPRCGKTFELDALPSHPMALATLRCPDCQAGRARGASPTS